MIKAVTYYSLFAFWIVIALSQNVVFPTFKEYIVKFKKVYADSAQYQMRK